ncbi:MAG TPA: ADP-ribosylglycohydrolase family protein [Steroidobacteraceae bacterium]|nr:ADP-ribosylglycohydrolase family protein [Steroidobacteraceae bacterium]
MPAPSAAAKPLPKSPLPNSYWVVPGRLLAGEHPGANNLSDTTDRLQALLCAGVTMFVDLTEAGEVPEYSHLLIYAAGVEPIKYERFEIMDHDVPDSPLVMRSILDTIDEHTSRNGVVYVHCRAGIGRTGTAVGCYLARIGFDGDAALERLNELWLESERSRTWPNVPETRDQIEFVRAWRRSDPKVNASQEGGAKSDRYIGALLGMAIGDALGAVAERTIKSKLVVPVKDFVADDAQGQPRGAWLSDTAMCWALGESLLSSNGANPEDQMQQYFAWQKDGKYSSTGVALNVPNDARKAIAQWQWTRKPLAGSHDPNNRDSHALARSVAAVLYFSPDPSRALVEAGEVARTTLQAPIALDANRAFAVLLLDALAKVEKDTLLSMKRSENAERLRRNRVKIPVTQVMDGWWRGPTPPARNDRDCLAVLSVAMWAFDQTDNYKDAVLMAVNSSANPASCGAVIGALAGAYYGVHNIPQQWRKDVLQAESLLELAKRLTPK